MHLVRSHVDHLQWIPGLSLVTATPLFSYLFAEAAAGTCEPTREQAWGLPAHQEGDRAANPSGGDGPGRAVVTGD